MVAPSQQPASLQRIVRFLTPHVTHAAALPGMDRYRKSFPALAHLWILIIHGLTGSPSLRQTHATLAVQQRLWQQWGLRRFVSRSQLARSSSSRPVDGALYLFHLLVECARRQPVADPHLHLLSRVQILDSTFLRLSASLSPWSRHGRGSAAVALQCGLDLAGEIPSFLVLHERTSNDRRALAERDLTPLAGWTLIFDRGYYAHRHFARLLSANVDFITRRVTPAVYQIVASMAVPTSPTATGERITADLVIDLGSPHNRTGTIVSGLRLIQYRTSEGDEREILTSRHDLGAAELIWLYHRRWRIELFFRFLKQQLGLIRPLGRTRQAVWLSVVMIIIVALLLVLVEPLRPVDISRIAWARMLAAVCMEHLYALRL